MGAQCIHQNLSPSQNSTESAKGDLKKEKNEKEHKPTRTRRAGGEKGSSNKEGVKLV